MSAGVLAYIGRLRAADGSDADLLRAYARHRDADAFAALVHRHGGRVWAVCRRHAGASAEDAFQATFLVLARKAAGLSPDVRLGGWLHATAVNVSRRAQTAAVRRKRHESVPPTPTEPPDEAALAALDEEIQRLPAKLREAVMLCELDGLSRKEAAEQLGVAEGTLSSRLATARKRLGERLTGRGVKLAAAAAVPAGLSEAACGLAAGAVPAPAVAALAGGTMRAMLLKGLAAGAVAVGLLAVGGRADEPKRPAAPASPKEGVILVTAGGSKVSKPARLFNPDGTELPDPTFGDLTSTRARLTPDGKAVAVVAYKPITSTFRAAPGFKGTVTLTYADVLAQQSEVWGRAALHLFPLDAAAGEPALDDVPHLTGAWAADGKRFYGSEVDPKKADGPKPAAGDAFPLVSWVYDPATKAKTPLAVPAGLGVEDVSRDGKLILARAVRFQPRPHFDATSAVVRTDTFEAKPVGGDGFWGGRISPDGTRVLGGRYDPVDIDHEHLKWRWRPAVVRLSDGAVTDLPLPGKDDNVRPLSMSWSPDGKRLALVWEEAVDPKTTPEGKDRAADGLPRFVRLSRLVVCDADGAHWRVLYKADLGEYLYGVDWQGGDPPAAVGLPKPTQPGQLLLHTHPLPPQWHMLDGRPGDHLPERFGDYREAGMSVSPDRRWVAWVPRRTAGDPPGSFGRLTLSEAHGNGDDRRIDLPPEAVWNARLYWSADSGKLLVTAVQHSVKGQPDNAATVVTAPDWKATAVPLPDRVFACDLAPAGDRLLVGQASGEGKGLLVRLAWMPVAGGPLDYLTPAGEFCTRGRVSADGRRVFYLKRAGGVAAAGFDLVARRLADGVETTLVDGRTALVHEYVPSPDGRSVAYLTMPRDTPADATRCVVSVDIVAADGRDRRVAWSREQTGERAGGLFQTSLLSWR